MVIALVDGVKAKTEKLNGRIASKKEYKVAGGRGQPYLPAAALRGSSLGFRIKLMTNVSNHPRSTFY